MPSTPLYDPPRVGGDVLAWCTKCKMDLAHVVVSMLGSRPAKVICKTCKSQHNYKLGAPGSVVLGGSAKPAARKPAVPRTTVRASEYWETKMAEKKNSAMLDYNVKEEFQKGDLLRHNNFGVGIVEEVKRGGKIVVLFREGERVLVHALGKPGVA